MSENPTKSGKVFVVATPIGNIDDISPRAVKTLKNVALIAAEDTRHSKKLLMHYGINTPLTSYHEHNESEKSTLLLQKIQAGEDIALISDAGTPLISDPGFRLIEMAQQANVDVSAIPGPCAAIAALSIAGLPSDRFLFAGFLPSKAHGRRTAIEQFLSLSMTVILYESCHRILFLLNDLHELCPVTNVVIARELTKTYETVLRGTPETLLEILQNDSNQQRGEFVVLIEATASSALTEIKIEVQKLLESLLTELPLKKAVSLATEITGERKNQLYKLALTIRKS